MKNLFPVIPCEDVAKSSRFYVDLLGLEPVWEADWYVQLRDPETPSVEIGFVSARHPSIPASHHAPSSGVVVTMEVDDVDAVHEHAEKLGCEIVYALRDDDWGQRHFMTVDPSGLLVDVVKLIPPKGEFAAPDAPNA